MKKRLKIVTKKSNSFVRIVSLIMLMSFMLLTACGKDNNDIAQVEQTEEITAQEDTPDASEGEMLLQDPQNDPVNNGFVYYEIKDGFESENGKVAIYYDLKMPQLASDDPVSNRMNEQIQDFYREQLEIAKDGMQTSMQFYEEDLPQRLEEERDAQNLDDSDANNNVSDSMYIIYNYSYSIDYTIPYYSDEYLSILFEAYEYAGGAHGMPYRFSIIFNTKTGEEVSGAELFDIDETAFVEIKNNAFKELFESNPTLYWENAMEIVQNTENSYETGYYLTEEGVTFYYPPYDLAPYAAGFVEVTVPYEQIPLKMN